MSEQKKPTLLQRTIGWSKEKIEWALDTLGGKIAQDAILHDLGLKPRHPVHDSKDENIINALKSIKAYQIQANPESSSNLNPTKEAMAKELGIKPGQLKDISKTKKVQDAFKNIETYLNEAVPSKLGYLSVVEDFKTIVTAVKAIFKDSDVFDGDIKISDEELVHRFFEITTLTYIRLKWPFLYYLAQPFGFIEESVSIHASGKTYPDRFVDLLSGQVDYLKKIGWPPENEDQARVLSDMTFVPFVLMLAFGKQLLELSDFLKVKIVTPISDFADETDLTKDHIYGWDFIRVSDKEKASGKKDKIADILSDRTLTFEFSGTKKDVVGDGDLGVSISCTMIWVPADHGGPGLFVAIGGSGQIEKKIGKDWLLTIKSDFADAVDFLIGKKKVQLASDGSIGFTLLRASDSSGLPEVFPDRSGTRLEFDQISFSGEISRQGAGIKLLAEKCALILSGKDPDGFIADILPSGETRIGFNLGLGLSTNNGFYIEGGTGLQTFIPIAKSLGPVTINHLMLGLVPTPDTKPAKIAAEVSASLVVKLGPVKAIVEQIGFQSEFAFPESGGSDLSFGFKPPKGIGLSIDSKAITGGGYLFFDQEKEEYAGIVQLEFQDKFSLTAIGLLTTRMPDGAKGFSLLLIISSDDFAPINLGFGFTLNGVGGLLGINRTVAVEVLRSGLKNRSLDSVLFPEDPLRNAPQIVSNLQAVFPPVQDQYVFGPMAVIGWGNPTILEMDLGIVFDFPSPTRLIILGQLRAYLPSKEKKKKPVIALKMDALGVINFDKGEVSLDAMLYDSKLLGSPMTGDMALRSRWKDDPMFALAVGGLHPRFPAPAGFPTLSRVSVGLTSGKNPRVRLDTYLALTSNSVQFGGRLDLFVKAASFSVEGYFQLDALFIFDPFQFITEFEGGIALKWHGRMLMGIHLEAALSGPTPWNVQGKATFKIWRFSKSVCFDETFGSDKKPALPPPVDPMPQLLEALRDTRNWNTELPKSSRMLVTLREIPPSEEVLVHPLGELTVRQRVVPLNIEILKFGNTRPSGQRRFKISQVSFNNETVSDTEEVTDHFAAAQFLELTENEKLSRPSFEQMDSGVRLGAKNIQFGEPVQESMEYETFIIEEKIGGPRKGQLYHIPEKKLEALANSGAASRSPLLHSGASKFKGPSPAVTLKTSGFTIATTDNLAAKEDISGLETTKTGTFSEAKEGLRQFLVDHPEDRGRFQVVKTHRVLGGK